MKKMRIHKMYVFAGVLLFCEFTTRPSQICVNSHVRNHDCCEFIKKNYEKDANSQNVCIRRCSNDNEFTTMVITQNRLWRML